jgi:two-component system, NtrC family, nitrogen regulation response regulator GlnG
MANEPATVWVVDDDHAVRFVLLEALREAGYRVQGFDSARAALSTLDDETARPDLVFTDVRMPGLDGLGFLDQLKARRPALPVIVMSAYTDIASTAGAFRGGAHDFLSKPFDLDDAVALAARALPEATPVQPIQGEDGGKAQGELLGRTPAMRELFRAIGRLAQAPIGVLVTGETGTGKELVARALHRESPRARGPFVALNTAAIPAELLESELFGHEAGAFTGAGKRHVGRFEQAHGGSLFLDEIGDMPAPLQTRLLRVLAEGEFFRVGGRELIRVDVRVLAATHQDLDRLVAEGRFRADLLHRLDVVRLSLPPLRERKADLGLLATRFLAEAAQKLGTPPKQLSADALRRLEQHDWPGNIRELQNLCWRLAALAPGDSIAARDLRTLFQPRAGSSNEGADWTAALTAVVASALERGDADVHASLRERFDQVVLDAALQHTGGHRQQAAARLGLGRNTLTRKLGAARPRGKR